MTIDRIALEYAFQNGSEFLHSPFRDYNRRLNIDVKYREPSEDCDNERLKELLFSAVENNMRKHFGKQIGIFLSGGLDSTLLLKYLVDIFGSDYIHGYHVSFEDPVTDEKRYASRVARDFGIDLTLIDMSVKRQKNIIKDCVENCRSVMNSIVYSYGMLEDISYDKIDVVVNAIGPDEYFAAYPFDTRYMERRKLYPFVNSYGRYGREFPKRFGFDKSFFLNNIAINVNKSHVIGTKECMSNYYDTLREKSLWSNMRRYFFERDLGGYYRLTQQPGDFFGIAYEFPFLEKNLAEYCFSLKLYDIYNKRPMRQIMKEYGISEEIYLRGISGKIGYGEKVGWTPSPGFYRGGLSRKAHENIESLKHIGTDYLSEYTLNNISKWLKNGDRRIMQCSLFLQMLSRELS